MANSASSELLVKYFVWESSIPHKAIINEIKRSSFIFKIEKAQSDTKHANIYYKMQTQLTDILQKI